jgi:hypothetical protein
VRHHRTTRTRRSMVAPSEPNQYKMSLKQSFQMSRAAYAAGDNTRQCIAKCEELLGDLCIISDVTADQFTLQSYLDAGIKVVFVMSNNESGYAYYAYGSEPVCAARFGSLNDIHIIITAIYCPDTIRRNTSSAF